RLGASTSIMKLLGIDLSSQPRDTAACMIERRAGKMHAEEPRLGCDDETLDALIARADAVGIDAPFGWPEAFREVVAGWTSPSWNNALRDRLRFRGTDLAVTKLTGLRPLSVSTDQIALPAMRAMALLHRNEVTDKSGDGRFFEVYPAASLFCWKLPHKGYKGAGEERRTIGQSMVEQLRRQFPG